MRMIFVLKDLVAGSYQQPFFEVNLLVALRAIGDELKREGSELALHVEDYELWQLGTYDPATGEIVSDRLKVFPLVDLLKKG